MFWDAKGCRRVSGTQTAHRQRCKAESGRAREPVIADAAPCRAFVAAKTQALSCAAFVHETRDHSSAGSVWIRHWLRTKKMLTRASHQLPTLMHNLQFRCRKQLFWSSSAHSVLLRMPCFGSVKSLRSAHPSWLPAKKLGICSFRLWLRASEPLVTVSSAVGRNAP